MIRKCQSLGKTTTCFYHEIYFHVMLLKTRCQIIWSAVNHKLIGSQFASCSVWSENLHISNIHRQDYLKASMIMMMASLIAGFVQHSLLEPALHIPSSPFLSRFPESHCIQTSCAGSLTFACTCSSLSSSNIQKLKWNRCECPTLADICTQLWLWA